MAMPVISAAPVTVGEADGYATFVVQLSAPSASAVSVHYETANGTAVANTDYIDISGSLTFAPGQTVQTVRVPIVNGSTVPPKGDFFLDLYSASGATIGNSSAMATIIANTAPSGTPVMAVNDPVADAAAAQVSFVVTLNKPSTGTVTVNYTTAAGSDTAKDFVPTSGTLAFAPGETAKTVTVLLSNPGAAEPAEAFNLVLTGVSGATLPDAVGIAQIGPARQPTVSTPVISAAPVTVGEADGYATFVVQLSAPSASAVSVYYETANGTAVANTDISGSLTFASGQTVQTVRVPIVDVTTTAAQDGFFLDLYSASGATIASSSTMVAATILNNGHTLSPPTISGAIAGQATTDEATIKPLSKIVIADPNMGQTETISVILLAAANGRLSNLGTGSYNATTGVYTVLCPPLFLPVCSRRLPTRTGFFFKPSLDGGLPLLPLFSPIWRSSSATRATNAAF